MVVVLVLVNQTQAFWHARQVSYHWAAAIIPVINVILKASLPHSTSGYPCQFENELPSLSFPLFSLYIIHKWQKTIFLRT
jgi:hypothetical protein